MIHVKMSGLFKKKNYKLRYTKMRSEINIEIKISRLWEIQIKVLKSTRHQIKTLKKKKKFG